MSRSEFETAFSSKLSSQHVEEDKILSISDSKDTGRLLQQRLELVEDLWQTVLRSECPADQADRLLRLKELTNPLKKEIRLVYSVIMMLMEPVLQLY